MVEPPNILWVAVKQAAKCCWKKRQLNWRWDRWNWTSERVALRGLHYDWRVGLEAERYR